MDVQIYYRKIREVEQVLSEPYVVVVSQETPDGGRPGVMSEVPRRTAAKMIVEGMARQATDVEALDFHERKAEAKSRADQVAAASRMQFTVVSPNELRRLKGARPVGE
jgi:hypothetical protein